MSRYFEEKYLENKLILCLALIGFIILMGIVLFVPLIFLTIMPLVLIYDTIQNNKELKNKIG